MIAVLLTNEKAFCKKSSLSDLDHTQLKQLCDDALKKIEQLIESASKAGVGSKQYDLIKADLHTAIMVAGENQAKLASAQVCLFFVVSFIMEGVVSISSKNFFIISGFNDCCC